MSGDSSEQIPGTRNHELERKRSSSNVSSASLSSVASAQSFNSGLSDSYPNTPPAGHNHAGHIQTAHTSAESSSSSASRRRSHSIGKNNGGSSSESTNSSFTGLVLEEGNKHLRQLARHRPRPLAQGPLYHILNNFKSFSRDSKEYFRGEHPHRHDSTHGSHSPTVSPPSSHRSQRSADLSKGESRADAEEAGTERGRRSSRNSGERTRRERSLSPSLRRKLPSLATLVPSSNSNTSDADLSRSRSSSGRSVLGRRSRSSSRANLDSSQDSGQSSTLLAPPSQTDIPRRRRSSSSASTLKSHIAAAGEAILSIATPSFSTTTTSQESQPNSPVLDNSLVAENAAAETERLRHVDLPKPAMVDEEGDATLVVGESDASSRPTSLRGERPTFLRVYRSDGTFGTIACPIDICADRLLKLVTRKFFIANAEDYYLVALQPSSVRILSPDAKPARFIRNLLIHAGYQSFGDNLNDVSRDDTSFVCRIVLVNINEPLRPPMLMQGMRELVLVNTDVVDAPGLACSDPRFVETLDVSRSAFQGTSTTFPRLRHLRMSQMFLPDDMFPSALEPQMQHLMANLTELDLSGNGLSNLNGVDFTDAPHLTHVNLRGNQLIELPSSLLHLPFLDTLICGTNALSHFDIWNPSIRKIDLSYNNLSRLLLTDEQALQMVNLESLQLCANSLESLPESLQHLPKLAELDVRHNLISRPLEAMTRKLKKLVASYNNPRLAPFRNPSTSSREPHEGGQSISDGLLNVETLKLQGLHTLEIREKFNMNNLTYLDMRNTHMTYVDEYLFNNTPHLRVLNLSNNSLTRLPGSVRYLLLLEELYVANNSLVDLPAELFELPNLHILDAHANNLEVLPPRMTAAPKLRILNLASNLIASLPESTENVHSCCLLELTLCDNQLNEDCFKVILQITTLRILNLSYNFITELPYGVFSQLPSLEEFYLAGNRILALPHDDFAYATQLRILSVNGNKLHTLPAELSKAQNLEVLDAAANQLRYNVANWPFDWNWRWNKKLRFLNFSSNRRLEIRKSMQYVDEEAGTVDLADLCVLPNLTTLGLIDVTLTSNSVPFQTENCRVRTFGSDLQSFRVGIAEALGFRPLANNDLVVENFRNREDEFLVAIFDGHNEYPGSGNKISHLAQETFAALLKQEMQVKDTTTVDALRRAFLSTHREIGNTALLSTEEIAHTPLGHRSPSALRLEEKDASAGTGATVLYFQGHKVYIATVGGARVILSRSNGTHSVLSKPLPPAAAELDRIRSSGGYVDPKTSYVNGKLAHPRLIGCYTAGTAVSAAPSIYEYEFQELNVADQIVIGSPSMWEVMRHETAADVVRSSSQYPVLAAMKLRDFAIAYGCRDRMMALVIGRPWSQSNDDLGRNLSAGDIYDEELASYRKRRQALPEDSTLARLGTEITPPIGEVTMVFTDIKNSTYLWESHPALMRAAIKTHNSLMRRSIRLMDGYEVKNEGDAFIISFHTPVKALIWCLTVQQHLITAEWPPELLEVDGCSPIVDHKNNVIFCGLSVRMGIHCGRPVAEPDPVTRRMDYFGPMVNRASRISGIALGGQTSVSADFLNMLNRDLEAHRQVKRGVPVEEAYSFTNATLANAFERSAAVLDHTEYIVKELGELKLRGIENPEHIYNIYPASLATREQFYEEHEADEVRSRSDLQPVLKNIVTTSSNIDSTAPRSIDPLSPTSPKTTAPLEAGDKKSVDLAVAASLGLPSVMSLSGMTGSGSVSIPGTPMAAPIDEDRRPSDGFSLLSGQSSRGSSEHLETIREPPRKHGLHSQPLRPTETFKEFASYDESPDFDVRLQLLAKRLETLCVSVSGEVNLQPLQQLLDAIDPPIQVGYEGLPVARLLWLTRIESSIARLQQMQENPSEWL